MVCKSFPSLWNLEEGFIVPPPRLGDFKWSNRDSHLGSWLWNETHPDSAGSTSNWSSRMNQRAIKTNCALCGGNPLAYKWSSENNLKVVTKLLQETFFFLADAFLNSKTSQCLQLSLGVPNVRHFQHWLTDSSHIPSFSLLPYLPAGCRDPGDLGAHVLRMPVPLSTWVPEWRHGAKHPLHHSHCHQPGTPTSNFLWVKSKCLLCEVTEICGCLY